ncbi:MAG: phosphodiester glycosidase family protein [Acetivibrionales bacterium]
MGRNAGKGKRGYAGGTSRGHAGNTRRNNPGKIRGGTGGTYQGSAGKRRGSTKKSARSRRRRIFAFLIFQFVFALITMPLLIFYGPFEEVRGTLVGASWNTLNHRYIARFFLSDEAITRIIRSSFADDPTARGETLQKLDLSGGHDSTIEVYNIEGRDFEGKLMVVHDPARIAVGYSSMFPDSGETTSQIAKNNGAVAAINAGGFLDSGWTGTGGIPMGFIIHDGEVIFDQYDNRDVKQETVAFTEEGMLIVGRHTINQLMEYGVKEGVSFGPPLIVNGKPTIKKGDGGWGIAPRTAIGQRKTGEVLLLVIDGRTLDSFGATLREIQDILLEYGAFNAANLDGGSSTTMYYNGKVINRPSDKLGERLVPSAFVVMPEKTGPATAESEGGG